MNGTIFPSLGTFRTAHVGTSTSTPVAPAESIALGAQVTTVDFAPRAAAVTFALTIRLRGLGTVEDLASFATAMANAQISTLGAFVTPGDAAAFATAVGNAQAL